MKAKLTTKDKVFGRIIKFSFKTIKFIFISALGQTLKPPPHVLLIHSFLKTQ